MKTLTAFPKGMWFVAPVLPLTQVIHEGAEGGCFAREDYGGLLRGDGTQAIDLRAVHAGGRTILDALHNGFTLDDKALAESRAVVAEHGNMSSAAVMFVLKPMLSNSPRGKRGRATDLAPVSLAGSASGSLGTKHAARSDGQRKRRHDRRSALSGRTCLHPSRHLHPSPERPK
jgi:Chalcone and stilbene synthases, C-terminal domain